MKTQASTRSRVFDQYNSRVIASLQAHLHRLKRNQEPDIKGDTSQGRLIEIFFSVIQKKVISPNDFPSLEKLSGTLLAFVDRYNQTARPFSWKYTASDLKDLLRRISEHEKQNRVQQSGLVTAA